MAFISNPSLFVGKCNTVQIINVVDFNELYRQATQFCHIPYFMT